MKNRSTQKTLLWLSMNLGRVWTSPLFYWIMRYTKYLGAKLPDKWDGIKDLGIEEFSREIMVGLDYAYLDSPLGGILDNSPQEKNFFFLERKYNRDCTNWSRMYRWWGEHNGHETHEIAIKNLENGEVHAVTVIKFEDGYEVFDYNPTYKREETIDDALKNNVVGYRDFVWVHLKG